MTVPIPSQYEGDEIHCDKSKSTKKVLMPSEKGVSSQELIWSEALERRSWFDLNKAEWCPYLVHTSFWSGCSAFLASMKEQKSNRDVRIGHWRFNKVKELRANVILSWMDVLLYFIQCRTHLNIALAWYNQTVLNKRSQDICYRHRICSLDVLELRAGFARNAMKKQTANIIQVSR